MVAVSNTCTIAPYHTVIHVIKSYVAQHTLWDIENEHCLVLHEVGE